METRVEYEKVDSYKEELPCDECGAVTRTWKLMRINMVVDYVKTVMTK